MEGASIARTNSGKTSSPKMKYSLYPKSVFAVLRLLGMIMVTCAPTRYGYGQSNGTTSADTTRRSTSSIVQTVELGTKYSRESLKDLRKGYRYDRQVARIKRKNIRKNKVITRYYHRTEQRRIQEIVYDFDQRQFVCGSNKSLPIEGCAPPYEIHELDGVRIVINNVNPFIYSVDLFELQNDRISNEKLSESSQRINLKISTPPITSFSFQRKPVSSSQKEAHTIMANNDTIQSLRNRLHANDTSVTQKALNHIYGLENQNLAVINKLLDDALVPKFKADGTAEKTIAADKRRDLESALSFNLELLERRVSLINSYIALYNQLLFVVNTPENNYSQIAMARDNLLNSMGLGPDIDMVPGNYLRELQLLKETTKLIQRTCDGLLDTDKSNLDAKIVRIQVDQLSNELEKFDHHRLTGNITTLFKLINPANFSLVYETQSIAENADNIRYRIEFRADDSFEVPRSIGNFNLDITLNILEGLKLDVSPTIVMDLGLVDPAYYFDKTVENVGGVDKEFVTIKQNSGNGNMSPSIGAVLNAYKRGSTNFKFGGSMGFGVSNKLRFRLYLGPSLIIGRQERLVITSGVAIGLVERLADEFTLGEKVEFPHSSLPNNVPVIADRFKLGGFVSLGFNLTGKQNKSFFEKIKFN